MSEHDWTAEHGFALRDRRVQSGLSQEALAEAAGVAARTIRALEHGARAPRPSTIQLLADSLRCQPDDLWRVNGGVEVARLLPVWGEVDGGSAVSRIRAAAEVAVEPELLVLNGGREKFRRRRWMRLVATAGLVALAFVVAAVIVHSAWNHAFSTSVETGALDPNLVAVAIFDNRTGDPELDAIGRRLADRVVQGLSESGVAGALATLSMTSLGGAPTARGGGSRHVGDGAALAASTGAGIVVSGVYDLDGDDLQILVQINDVRNVELVYAVPLVDRSLAAADEAIEVASDRILGALAAHYDVYVPSPRLAPPPRWAAYKEFRATYWSPNPPGRDLGLRERIDAQIQHAERALEIDPRFLAPRLKMFNIHDSVLPNRALAESCLVAINRQRSVATPYELLLAQVYNCLFEREYSRGLGLLHQLRDMAPREQLVLLGTGVFALILNRPHEAVEALESMEPDTWHSVLGRTRFWWLSHAYHAAGQYEKELEMARMDLFPDLCDVVSPAAALGDVDAVEQAVNRHLEATPPDDPGRICRVFSHAVGELRWHGYPEAAARLADRAVAFYENRPSDEAMSWSVRYNLASCLYMAGRWEQCQAEFEILAAERPGSIPVEGFLGALAARRGDRQRALEVLDELHRQQHFKTCSGIAALLGEYERAVQLIQDAYAHEPVFDLHGEMNLELLRGYPAFEEVIRPKG